MARPTLLQHPKFTRLVEVFNIPKPHALGYLEMMWQRAYESGSDLIGDEMDVKLFTGYPGDAPEITSALLGCGGPARKGFIEKREDDLFYVHDLFDHAPDYVLSKARREDERKLARLCQFCGDKFHSSDPRALYCKDSCRKSASRDRQRHFETDPSVSGDGQRQTETDCPLTPLPSLTRELYPPETTSPPPSGGGGGAAVSEFAGYVKTNWKDVKDPGALEIVEREAFPQLDLLHEARAAQAWCVANPSRAPKDHKRFFHNWLQRSYEAWRKSPAAHSSPSRNGHNGRASPVAQNGGATWSKTDDDLRREGKLI